MEGKSVGGRKCWEKKKCQEDKSDGKNKKYPPSFWTPSEFSPSNEDKVYWQLKDCLPWHTEKGQKPAGLLRVLDGPTVCQGWVTESGVICPFLYATSRPKRVNNAKLWVLYCM